MKSVDAIEAVISKAGKSTPVYLSISEWFHDDADYSDLEKTIEESTLLFQNYVNEIRARYGEPILNKQPHDEWVSWYPEAIYLCAWQIESKTAFIALVHYDKEDPVVIQVDAYTANEIKELEKA